MNNSPAHFVDSQVRFTRGLCFSTRFFCLLAGVIVLFALSGCASVEKVKDEISDRFSSSDSKSATDSFTAGESVPVEKSKKEILLTGIQESLDQLGYAPGRTDGKMDSQTEAAIQDFQLDNDLRINGRPSEKLLEAIQRKVDEK